MAGLHDILAERLQQAFDTLEPGADPVLRPSNRPGVDYQANGALPLAKRTGANPAELAAKVAATADLAGVCSTVEVAPQGFINLTLDDGFVARCLQAPGGRPPPRGGAGRGRRSRSSSTTPRPTWPRRCTSGSCAPPSSATPCAGCSSFAGHTVIRENHIGDWGTPFGMLIEHLIDIGEEAGGPRAVRRRPRRLLPAGPDRRSMPTRSSRDRSRRRVVLLQSGDPETMRLWGCWWPRAWPTSTRSTPSWACCSPGRCRRGELLQRPAPAWCPSSMPRACWSKARARCVSFLPGSPTATASPLPLIIRKSDGGYGYATTDLAALWDRFGRLGGPGALRGRDCRNPSTWRCASRWRSWPAGSPGKGGVHVGFGSILGDDHKMFRPGPANR